MRILQIKYFLAVAKYRSFQKAAEALYVSQPAVSVQISRLEEEWGFKLFKREYRDAILTQAGENMFNMLNQAAEEFEHAFDRSQHMSDAETFHMFLGVPEFLDVMGLPEIIRSFQQEHSDVVVNVEVCPSRLANFTHDFSNRFDVAINMEPYLSDNPILGLLPFSRGNYAFLIPEKHPLCAAGKPLACSDLNGQTIYVLEERVAGAAGRLCGSVCNSLAVLPEEIIEMPNFQSMLIAVRINGGVIFSDDQRKFDLAEHHLRMLKTDVEAKMVLGWRKTIYRPYVAELAEYISSRIQLSNQLHK